MEGYKRSYKLLILENTPDQNSRIVTNITQRARHVRKESPTHPTRLTSPTARSVLCESPHSSKQGVLRREAHTMFVSESRSSVPLFSCPLIKIAYPKGSILSWKDRRPEHIVSLRAGRIKLCIKRN